MFKNVEYSKKVKLSAWRKISIGSWRPLGDSGINVIEVVDMAPVFKYIEESKKEGNLNAEINGFFSLLFSRLLKDHPEFNVVVRGGKIHQRKSVDTFFHVIQPKFGGNLSGVTVRGAELKTYSEISKEFTQKVAEIKQGKKDKFSKSKSIFSFLPGFFSKTVLDLIGFLNYFLNLNLSFLGVPKDAFGSLMISNVGSLGISEGYSIIAPYSRIPMVVCIGALKKTVVPGEGDKLKVIDALKLCFTIDHRIVDGFHIGQLLRSLRVYVESPERLENQAEKVSGV